MPLPTLAGAVLLALAPLHAAAQVVTPASQSPASEAGAPPYADMVDLLLAGPVAADAVVRSATRIKGAEAAGVAPNAHRFYVEADVGALIRSPGPLPARIGWLVDMPLDARGAAPKLKKTRVLVFARPVPGAPGQVQLAAPDAQIPWTAAADARARRITRELLDADAAPAVTGVGDAFHVPGALPGEGETQVFLRTADGKPVSLSVLRRPGEPPRFAVALSEIVDEAAGPPAPDTLLWFRLACGLPRALPPAAVAQLEAADAARAREDYAHLLGRLGPCVRRRTVR